MSGSGNGGAPRGRTFVRGSFPVGQIATQGELGLFHADYNANRNIYLALARLGHGVPPPTGPSDAGSPHGFPVERVVAAQALVRLSHGVPSPTDDDHVDPSSAAPSAAGLATAGTINATAATNAAAATNATAATAGPTNAAGAAPVGPASPAAAVNAAAAAAAAPDGPVDAGDDPLQCPHCIYHARTKGNLHDHVKFIHIGTKCMWPGCDHVSGRETMLRKHLIREHWRLIQEDQANVDGNNATVFGCPWPGCTIVFATKPSTKRHVYFHTWDLKKAAQ
ncbi:hypothetical protein M426DRAFT_27345 [Hypoxylon sp. CI-4A]|nr:hypothetical protein M426DRAFT_27345 [Hypoxylon sp. CI-4A]